MYGSIGSGRPSEEDSIQSVMARNFAKPPSSDSSQSYSRDLRYNSTHSAPGSGGLSRGVSRDQTNDYYSQSSYGSAGMNSVSFSTMSSTGMDRNQSTPMHPFSYGQSTPPVHRESLTTVVKQGLEIEALQKEVSRLNQKLTKPDISTVHNMDPSAEAAFREIAAKVRIKNEEISRLENTIEALVGQGGYDEAAAYRVCSKMQALVSENKRLGGMLSAGRAMQHEIEIGILRVENENLQKKLEQVGDGSQAKFNK